MTEFGWRCVIAYALVAVWVFWDAAVIRRNGYEEARKHRREIALTALLSPVWPVLVPFWLVRGVAKFAKFIGKLWKEVVRDERN